MEDFRSKEYGSIEAALMIWEACIIPYMLYNASSWIRMKEKDIEKLTNLQNYFCNMILAIQKCPAALMIWDLGIFRAPWGILRVS